MKLTKDRSGHAPDERGPASLVVGETPALEAGPLEDSIPGMVSVVVPCYNYARYLRGCVASVLEQQGDTPVEVIVVDDCSTDETEAVGRDLARDERVTYLRNGQNLGHIATYNRGLSRARGQYVALVSADDLVAPGSLSRAAAAMDRDAGVVLVYGPVAHVYDASPEIDPGAFATGSADFDVVSWTGFDWVERVVGRAARNPIASPEAVVRTAAQRRAGGYRPDLPHAGDLEMWLRLATLGRVAQIQGPTQAIRRMHSQNMSEGFSGAADLRQVDQALAVFQAYAEIAWSRSPVPMGGARRVLARRAIRTALDLSSAGGNRDEALRLRQLARELSPAVAAGPGSRLLGATLRERRWAGAAMPVRNAALSRARRVKPAVVELRERLAG